LAVATLLQYTENDYTPAEKRPQSQYGQYDYKKRLYYYTLIDYPECANLLLLTSILFGNDSKRSLQVNKLFILGKQLMSGSSYYYSPENVKEVKTSSSAKTEPREQQANADSGVLQSAISSFKSLFGKKPAEVPEKQTVNPVNPDELKPESQAKEPRLELFPEFWDEFPEVSVQLLMQAQMNLIHQFAYNNLKRRPDFAEICLRFDEKAILRLLDSEFQAPNLFGLDILKQRVNEFSSNPVFIGKVLNSNNKQVCEWAQALVGENPGLYTADVEFIIQIIFNACTSNHLWINDLLKRTFFAEDRLKVLLGKTITGLLQLENTEKDSQISEFAIDRIGLIASRQMEQLSWDIVGQLLTSSLLNNILFASRIILQKAQRVASTDIPVLLVDEFLKNEIPEVRQNGVQLLNRYSDSFLSENIKLILNHVDSPYQDIVEIVLATVRKLLLTHSDIGNLAIHHLAYTLIRKETFEGSHAPINAFVNNELKSFWNTGLNTKDLIKLIHAQYRETQLTAYEILKNYSHPHDFTIGQIISFGNHEILAIRQWCWNYFRQNVARIRYEREKALNLLDSKWDDTREYAFHFFKTEFTENDWDTDTLIGIVDSVRPDVEKFGKELLMSYFKPENALEYLTKLSEHPSVNIQLFCTQYLSLYAADKMDKLIGLEFYFRSALTRVNKARVAKDRIFHFLYEEAVKTPEAAEFITAILDDISAQSTVQDKETCIHILTDIKSRYPHLDMHLMIKN
jgi:hypothetical protein